MNPNEIMKIAENFYESLSEEDIAEMEKVMLDRSNFFGERTNKLEEMLKGVNEENIHEETNWGEPVGKEIIE